MNKKSSFALIPLNQRLTLHETTKKEMQKFINKKEFNRKRKIVFIKDYNILLINYIKNNNNVIILFIYLNKAHKVSSSLSSIGAFFAASNSAVI